MSSLADALPAEIKRVTALKEDYIAFRNMPGVMVEPAIFMMTTSINAGVAALASGDVIEILRAYEDLKGYEK